MGKTHLHDLVLEGGEEEVDDLVLLNRERVKVDLLHGLDLAGLYETTELGDGLPLLLLALCAATGATTATAPTATVTAALGTATGSKSTSVGHFDCVVGRVRGGCRCRWWSQQQASMIFACQTWNFERWSREIAWLGNIGLRQHAEMSSSTQALTLGIYLGVLYMFAIMFKDSFRRPMSHYSRLSPEEQFRLDCVLFLSALVARSDALLKQIPLKALDDHQEHGNEYGLRLSIEM